MNDPAAHEPQAPDWEAFYANYRKPGYVRGYEITSKLGGGAFGIVYRARKQSIGKDYAIKFLKLDQDDEVRRGVLQELDSVRLFAQVDHPNLVSIEDQGVVDGLPYLVMGFAGSETLRDRLPARDGADRDELRRLFLQACRGVSALHEHALVHFDLKPGNIFIKGGVARVGDYGLSRLLSQSRATLSMGRGTPYYMAPELLRRHGDWRSDIYALGVILYEIVVGRVPFQGESEWEVLKKHETEQPELPTDLDRRDREVLARALAKDPAARFQSAAELMHALLGDSHAAWSPPPAPASEPPPRPDPSMAQAKAKLKTAARDVSDAAATIARHAAHRARDKAQSALIAAHRMASAAGVAPFDVAEDTVVGVGPGSILKAHLHAYRLRRRVRRANRRRERETRRALRRAQRRARFPVLLLGFMGVAAIGVVLTFSGRPPRITVSQASFASSSASPWQDPDQVRRALPPEVRSLVSRFTPEWRRVGSGNPIEAEAYLNQHLEEFQTGLPTLIAVIRRNPTAVPGFGPVQFGSTSDYETVAEAMHQIADGRDADGRARATLLAAGRDALETVAAYLESEGGSVLRPEDRARFARLNEFLRGATGFTSIRYDADSPSSPAIDDLNGAAGTLWRWFLREFAYDEASWQAYLTLQRGSGTGRR